MMRIHFINPSDTSFGTAVITPRWLYVLAAATPLSYGTPQIVDETLDQLDPKTVSPGDVVGIGIHTGNALRGYKIGRIVRERGATVVFGGIHSTLFPEEAYEHGAAHAVVKGDGDLVWPDVLRDVLDGTLKPLYDGGRVGGTSFLSARCRPHQPGPLPRGCLWGSGPSYLPSPRRSRHPPRSSSPVGR